MELNVISILEIHITYHRLVNCSEDLQLIVQFLGVLVDE